MEWYEVNGLRYAEKTEAITAAESQYVLMGLADFTPVKVEYVTDDLREVVGAFGPYGFSTWDW